MAKAASPIRLQKELMESAKQMGALMHRSAAEQIEYWATIGQRVSEHVNPETLLSVKAGLSRIVIEKVADPVIDFDDLISEVDSMREDGSLTQAIAAGQIKYQGSKTHPGFLERVSPDGITTLGVFKNGEFIEVNPNEE